MKVSDRFRTIIKADTLNLKRGDRVIVTNKDNNFFATFVGIKGALNEYLLDNGEKLRFLPDSSRVLGKTNETKKSPKPIPNNKLQDYLVSAKPSKPSKVEETKVPTKVPTKEPKKADTKKPAKVTPVPEEEPEEEPVKKPVKTPKVPIKEPKKPAKEPKKVTPVPEEEPEEEYRDSISPELAKKLIKLADKVLTEEDKATVAKEFSRKKDNYNRPFLKLFFSRISKKSIPQVKEALKEENPDFLIDESYIVDALGKYLKSIIKEYSKVAEEPKPVKEPDVKVVPEEEEPVKVPAKEPKKPVNPEVKSINSTLKREDFDYLPKDIYSNLIIPKKYYVGNKVIVKSVSGMQFMKCTITDFNGNRIVLTSDAGKEFTIIQNSNRLLGLVDKKYESKRITEKFDEDKIRTLINAPTKVTDDDESDVDEDDESDIEEEQVEEEKPVKVNNVKVTPKKEEEEEEVDDSWDNDDIVEPDPIAEARKSGSRQGNSGTSTRSLDTTRVATRPYKDVDW